MTRFHIKKYHRNIRRAKGLFGQSQDTNGILAAGEKDGWPFKLSDHFTQDMNRLGFEILQVVKMIGVHSLATAFPPQPAWRPHSRFSSAFAGSK